MSVVDQVQERLRRGRPIGGDLADAVLRTLQHQCAALDRRKRPKNGHGGEVTPKTNVAGAHHMGEHASRRFRG